MHKLAGRGARFFQLWNLHSSQQGNVTFSQQSCWGSAGNQVDHHLHTHATPQQSCCASFVHPTRQRTTQRSSLCGVEQCWRPDGVVAKQPAGSTAAPQLTSIMLDESVTLALVSF